MKKKILVIGATGLVGKAVADQLSRDAYDVIVMSRNREQAGKMFSGEFEILEADVLVPGSMKHIFHGVDGLFISLPEKIAPAAIPDILSLARGSGVRQVVYVSGCTVRQENAWHPMIRGHYEAEKAIEAGGIPYTILRLTMVMDMIPRYANGGKPFILGKQVHGWSWIHSSDIARMASAAFTREASRNRKFTLWGHEKDTIAGAVERYNKAMGFGERKVKPRPYWMAHLLALVAGKKLRYAISIFKYFEDHPEEGDPREAYAILGEPRMSLDAFFRQEGEPVS